MNKPEKVTNLPVRRRQKNEVALEIASVPQISDLELPQIQKIVEAGPTSVEQFARLAQQMATAMQNPQAFRDLWATRFEPQVNKFSDWANGTSPALARTRNASILSWMRVAIHELPPQDEALFVAWVIGSDSFWIRHDGQRWIQGHFLVDAERNDPESETVYLPCGGDIDEFQRHRFKTTMPEGKPIFGELKDKAVLVSRLNDQAFTETKRRRTMEMSKGAVTLVEGLKRTRAQILAYAPLREGPGFHYPAVFLLIEKIREDLRLVDYMPERRKHAGFLDGLVQGRTQIQVQHLRQRNPFFDEAVSATEVRQQRKLWGFIVRAHLGETRDRLTAWKKIMPKS